MRESRAQLFAGTPLAKKRPRWLVAAERVATERQYLRTVAQVNPRWALRVAPHLVRFVYDDPQWDRGARPSHGARGRDAVRLDARQRAARRLRPRRAEGGAAAVHCRGARGRSGRASRPTSRRFSRTTARCCRTVLEAEARLRKRDLFVGEAGVAGVLRRAVAAERARPREPRELGAPPATARELTHDARRRRRAAIPAISRPPATRAS